MVNNTRTIIQRLIDRLTADERRGGALAGWHFDADNPTVDDGAYDDPMRDTRPDWLRDEQAEWHKRT